MSPEIPALIPAPAAIDARSGHFRLTPATRIRVVSGDDAAIGVGCDLAAAFERGTGMTLDVLSQSPGEAPAEGAAPLGGITLELAPSDEAPGGETAGQEGYLLHVEPSGVLIRAATAPGLFYGTQTLLQLMPPAIFERTTGRTDHEWTAPAVRVADAPRFGWRGMLLDCCRHFMDKEFVKRTIDLLAHLKMNRLHWHLTEDQGWRLEIERYPRLTEIGAWRIAEDGTRYGGYYTRADVREVVEHAARRHVTVVPEIELPGHAVAALAAYPELSCRGEPLPVENAWGIFDDVYCAGNEETFIFLEGVLTEVLELFPSRYVHIGGDECPKTRWRECPRCQARIRGEGLRDEEELQSYFIRRIDAWLEERGRRLVGWDEILEGGLAPGATVQSWRGMEGALAAARLGHDAIVSPTTHAYFDYGLDAIDLRRVYDFEPVPAALTEAEKRHILGGECNMWTERAPQETVDGKVFPRILAMAERLWSPADRRDFDEFRRRVERHYVRLRGLGVDYGAETAESDDVG